MKITRKSGIILAVSSFVLILICCIYIYIISSQGPDEPLSQRLGKYNPFTTDNEKLENENWKKLPEVKNLKNFRETEFLLTLENPLSDNKNAIYTPTFLYAWDKVKEKLNSPVKIAKENSLDFTLINKSKPHINALTEGEYEAEAEVSDGIYAHAFFHKTLPFECNMQNLIRPITFKNVQVPAFGMKHYDEKIAAMAEIMYYLDDNNFILKLNPKDKEQEIILAQGLRRHANLKDALKELDNLIAKAGKQKNGKGDAWKYYFTPEDMFAIPKIRFNIETNYNSLEGQHFITKDNVPHNIVEASQRTAFILNENGAVIESKSTTTTEAAPPEMEIPHLKKLVFDKPFLIILKRKDKPNPYFVMRVENADLMERVK